MIISETEQIHRYLFKSKCSFQCSRNNPLTAMKIPWEQSPFDPPRKIGRRKDFSRRIERTLLAGYYENKNKTKQNKTKQNRMKHPYHSVKLIRMDVQLLQWGSGSSVSVSNAFLSSKLDFKLHGEFSEKCVKNWKNLTVSDFPNRWVNSKTVINNIHCLNVRRAIFSFFLHLPQSFLVFTDDLHNKYISACACAILIPHRTV